MILESIAITGFRSVQDKLGRFWIKPRLTVLVGANEHGKSNLIDAISYLNKSAFTPIDRNRSKRMRDVRQSFPDLQFTLRPTIDETNTIAQTLDSVVDAMPESADEATQAQLDSLRQIVLDFKENPERKIELRLHRASGDQDVRRFIYTSKDSNSECHLDSTRAFGEATRKLLDNLLPQVISFNSTGELTNSITLPQLQSEENIAFVGLLKLVPAVWDKKEMLFQNSVGGRDFREEAKDKIQRKLRTIWSQGRQGEADLKIDFDLDTATSQLRIDFIDKSGTRDEPTQRSLGFRSFFSFYLKLFAMTQELDPHGYIFAFDEPGIHLHPSGQKDLLRELRHITETNQVIISTHSPFMIDRNPLTGVVVVTKDTEGTKLEQKPYRKNWAPLRASLGIVMSDSFFYADKSLFVEGTSDRIFVYALLQKLATDLDIDINFLSVIDGDDRKEMPAIARILLSEDRNLVVLTDRDAGGVALAKQITQLASELRKSDKLQEIDISKYVNKQDVSIEDLLPEAPLEAAIRKYLKEVLGKKVEFQLQDAKSPKLNLGKSLKDLFATQQWTSAGSSFSKTTVADLFSQILLSNKELVIEESAPAWKLCKDLRDILELK